MDNEYDIGPQEDTISLSCEQEELINRICYFQDQFEQPVDDDVQKIADAASENEDPSDVAFSHITQITILLVQLVFEFARRLPGFDKLSYEEQVSTLKSGSSEVLILKVARKYDFHTDTINFVNNQPCTRNSFSLLGIDNILDELLRFSRLMYAMGVNNTEYGLLTGIVIFSERPNAAENCKFKKIQEVYLSTLKAYVDSSWKDKASVRLAKLLSILTELRTLRFQHKEACSNLKLKNKKLPSLLAEIWDLEP